MFNDVEKGLPGWDKGSRNLYREQSDELRRAGRGGEGTALVVFLSYDTPNFLTVLSAQTAQDAAGRLAAEIDGTYATRSENTPLPNLGTIGHSYGTTVLVNAFTLTKHPVQSVTLVASAGIDGGTVTSFDQLNVDRDAAGHPKVYTTMAAKDNLAPFGSNVSGRLQPNPNAAWTADAYIGGAYSFSSDGHGDLKATTGHSIIQDDRQGYLDPGTQALRNVAAVSIGEPGRIVGDTTRTEKIDPTFRDEMAQNMVENGFGGRR